MILVSELDTDVLSAAVETADAAVASAGARLSSGAEVDSSDCLGDIESGDQSSVQSYFRVIVVAKLRIHPTRFENPLPVTSPGNYLVCSVLYCLWESNFPMAVWRQLYRRFSAWRGGIRTAAEEKIQGTLRIQSALTKLLHNHPGT